MKILVAGGTGFIGRAVVDALLEDGHAVVVVSRTPTQQSDHASRGVQYVGWNVALDPPPGELEEIGPIDAIVNLVGIARPEGINGFEQAHVVSVRRLVAWARGAGISRFIHVSVVRMPDAHGAYMETKARGEGVVQGSGLQWTILRPAAVYGPGDQVTSTLFELTRVSAVVPIPGGSPGMLALVDVCDVARSVCAALDRPTSIGKIYDIVGPERLSLHELVHRIAATRDLRVKTIALPVSLMRLTVALMQALLPRPPLSRTQLAMLLHGLHGNGTPARDELGVEPQRLSRERLRAIASQLAPQLPSLRLVPNDLARASLSELRHSYGRLRWLLLATLVLSLSLIPALPLPAVVGSGLVHAVALATVWGISGVPRRTWWSVHPWRLSAGLAFGLLYWGILRGIAEILALSWSLGPARVHDLPNYAGLFDLPIAPLILVAGSIASETLWRGAFTLVSSARLGPWRGVTLVAFVSTAAQASVFAAGALAMFFFAAWIAGAIAVRTRSLWSVLAFQCVWFGLWNAWPPG